jgi:single-stranded DNA-specific DHH superfamily exonuclease
VFISDLAVDSDIGEFEKFREAFDTFLIDHHPTNPILENKKNIIKTNSHDCSTYCIYLLGREILDDEEWGWLVCATMFSEFSYSNEKNFEFMKKFYPNLNLENISSSVPGINGRKIGNALIYYSSQIDAVYKMVKEKNLSEIEDIHKIIEDEIDFHIENYVKEARYYPEKKMYIYKLNSKYKIASPVITTISKYKPEYSFIIYSPRKENLIKVSARNQSSSTDMSELMKKGVQGLQDAVGGGHKAAAGATIQEEDIEKFIENILQ